MVEQRPVQTSAVYLLGCTQFTANPPPSPPSPITPEATDLCASIEELDLDGLCSSDAQAPPAPTLLDDRLAGAIHVLSTEATTLQCLARLYAADRAARDGFDRAVAAVVSASSDGASGSSPARRRRSTGGRGKLVVTGVGKSGHVGRKLAATFSSLSVPAVFLHPTEALHGDLGQISPAHDVLMLVTASGRTPELLMLLPHLDARLPMIVLTAAAAPELARLRPSAIVLAAPVHEPETVSFGVAAPTSSTTAAMAVGDALAMVVAWELHHHHPGGGFHRALEATPSSGVAAVFAANHPGGAIGAAIASSANPQQRACRTTVAQLAVRWDDIPELDLHDSATPAAEILRAGYTSPSGWVRVALPSCTDGVAPTVGVVSPSRIRRLAAAHLPLRALDVPGLVVWRSDFVCLAADTTLRKAKDWLGDEMGSPDEEDADDAVVGILAKEACIGVLELRTVMDESD
jgi:D-arabinose 5-phosphate isomerase GutQ